MKQNVIYVFIEIFVSKGKQERKKLKTYVRNKRRLFCFVLFEILGVTEELLSFKVTLKCGTEIYFKVLSSMDIGEKPIFHVVHLQSEKIAE